MTFSKKLFTWAQPIAVSSVGLLFGFGLAALCFEAAFADFIKLGLVAPAVLLLVPLQILELHRDHPHVLVVRLLAVEHRLMSWLFPKP